MRNVFVIVNPGTGLFLYAYEDRDDPTWTEDRRLKCLMYDWSASDSLKQLADSVGGVVLEVEYHPGYLSLGDIGDPV